MILKFLKVNKYKCNNIYFKYQKKIDKNIAIFKKLK